MPVVRHPSSPRRALRGAALAVAVASLAACGGTTTHGSDAAPVVPESQFKDLTGKRTVEVDAVDDAFQDRYIKVSAGTEVVFRNAGRVPHNVLAANQGAFPDIQTDAFMPGDTAKVTFDGPGTYPYYCSLHGSPTRGMNAEIIVEG